MLNLIYGRAGSGKTKYINDKICSSVKENNKEIILIVPEQTSFSSERKMLELLGPVDCNRVEVVMSFTHVAQSVFKLHGSNNLPTLDKSGKSVLMSMALEVLSDKLEIYSNKTQHSSIISDMINLTTKFRQSAINDEMIQDAQNKIEDELLKKKLSEINLIMMTYNTLLEGKYYDPDDKLTLLSKALDEFEFFRNKTVFVDGFSGFTMQEYKIIEKIIVQCDEAYFSICTDDIFENEDSFGVFAPSNKTARKLINIAKKNNVQIKSPVELVSEKYKSDEIETIEKNLFSKNKIKLSKSENVKVLSAENKIEECDYIACEIKRYLKKGYRCRDIAVVSRNGDAYDTLMKKALEKCEIPVFNDKRTPIQQQPLCVFVKCALEIAVKGINNDSIFRLLKTGVTDITVDEISEIENYVLMWDIGASGWKKPFVESPYGFGSLATDDVEIKLEKLNETRKRVIDPLIKFLKKIKADVDAKGACEIIFNLLQDVNAPENLKKIAVEFNKTGEKELAVLQERVWDCVMSVLNDIANLSTDSKKSISQIETLVNIAFSLQDLGNLPQGLDEIVVGDVMRTIMNEPKIVFVLGVNDRVFPKDINESGTFSYREKNILNRVGIELDDTPEEEYTQEKFLCYKTFSSPVEKLYVSFCRKDIAGNEIKPSEFVDELVSLFDDIEIISLSEENPQQFIESDKTALRIMSEKFNDNDSISESLKSVFEEKEEYKNTLKMLENMSKQKNIRIESEETARKLFGKNMYESPSKVETYHKCPFQYFCRYAIKAKKLEKSEIDARQRGSVIHYALENLIKIYTIKGLCEMEDSKLRDTIHNILFVYAEESLGGLKNKTQRFVKLYYSFERAVYTLIKRLVEEFRLSKFEPVDFELKIDKDGEIKPIEIPLSSGGVISLRGSIDRVDSFEMDGKNYIRVVDYKTGTKEFKLSDVFYGLNMQMIIYLFSIWANGEKKYGDVVPAGVLYMPSGEKYINANRNIDESDLKNENKKNIKLKGFVLSDSVIIESMEEGEKKIFIPASLDKENKPSGNVLTIGQIGVLKEKVDSILKDMGEELLKGNINAYPVKGKDYEHICEYCDYKDVCNIEEYDKRKEIKDKDFSEIKSTMLVKDGEENG